MKFFLPPTDDPKIAYLRAAALTSSALAEPAHLACSGKLRVVNAGGVTIADKYDLSLAIDMNARSVTVDSYEPVKIMGDAKGDTMVFMADPGTIAGVSTGTLNRITGAASIHVISPIDGLRIFEGTCKQAQKLF